MRYEINFTIDSHLKGKQLFRELQPFQGFQSNVVFSETDNGKIKCVLIRNKIDIYKTHTAVVANKANIDDDAVKVAICKLLADEVALFTPAAYIQHEYDQIVQIMEQRHFEIIGLRKITNQIRMISKSIKDVDEKIEGLIAASRKLIASASTDGCDTNLIAIQPEDKEFLTEAARFFIDGLSKKSYMKASQFNIFNAVSQIVRLRPNNRHKTSLIITSADFVQLLSSAIDDYKQVC